jgi:hypothetical protein
MPLFNVIYPSFVILDFYFQWINITSSELCKIAKERIGEAIELEMSAYFSAHVISLSQSCESNVLFNPSHTVILSEWKRWISLVSLVAVGRYFDMIAFLKHFCFIQEPM